MRQRTQAQAPARRPSHPEPQTPEHTSTRTHPAVPRRSRDCTRTLLSLPFLGHSVIRFLNLEATQGPARDPRPHPLPAVGRPGSCGRSTTRLGPLGPGGFWGLPGKVSHDPTQLWRCRATWGHPGAGHPALGHVARHTSSRSYRAFFLLLNHGLGTKPQGGEVWTKEENEWAKGKAELRGSATR